MTPDGSLDGDGLRETLEQACEEDGYRLHELTVLSPENDPFRVDTPARRRDGGWLATHAQELGLGDRVIHLRGLHYMLVSGEVVKPNGVPYANTDADWEWMSEDAAKAARWLGYLPWEQVRDARSSPPVVRIIERLEREAVIYAGVDVEIPEPEDLEPRAGVRGFAGEQPYKLVLFGEKTSLEEVLAPIAESRKADLYLPAGEISDTFLSEMARIGAEDGRPMVVLCFSDCDPAGWQMPVSIGRKLQGFKATLFPQLEFQVHRVALTPEHVREHGLPSTPLKKTEKRADRWRAAMGVQQTEIDALAALNPDLLRRIARDAIAPFFDTSLERRVNEARAEYLEEAQRALEEQLDKDEIDRIRDQAGAKLEELRTEIDAINEALSIDAGAIAFPEIVVPTPELDGSGGLPLIDSDWLWVEQTLALKASKDYGR